MSKRIEKLFLFLENFIGARPRLERFIIGVLFIPGLAVLALVFPVLFILGFMAPKNECNAQILGKTKEMKNA